MYKTPLAQHAATHFEARFAPNGERAGENCAQTAINAVIWAFIQAVLRLLDAFLLRPEPPLSPPRPARIDQPGPRQTRPPSAPLLGFRIERARRESAPAPEATPTSEPTPARPRPPIPPRAAPAQTPESTPNRRPRPHPPPKNRTSLSRKSTPILLRFNNKNLARPAPLCSPAKNQPPSPA